MLTLLKSTTERSYPGFSDKIASEKEKIGYEKFVKQLFNESAKYDRKYCFILLEKYVDYFQDSHLRLNASQVGIARDTVQSFFDSADTIHITDEEINLLKGIQGQNDICGIWYGVNSFYKIAITYDLILKDYVGTILYSPSSYWKRGQVRFRIKKTKKGKYRLANYYTRLHTSRIPGITVTDSLIRIRDFDLFYKVRDSAYRSGTNTFDPKSIEQNTKLNFQVLNDSTCLLSIPYFGQFFTSKIDSLIKSNYDVIKQKKYLLIDIRDNPGGVITSFSSILPLIYTDTIRYFGASVLSTNDHIAYYEGLLESTNLDKETKADVERIIRKMKEKKNQLVEIWNDKFVVYDTVHEQPKRVGILMNENTGSSAELFVEAAKQSMKVVLFGENTNGSVDYGDLRTIILPCKVGTFSYPLLRNNRVKVKKVDGVGFKPDVEIGIAEKNWVSFVMNFFKTK